MNIQSVSNFNVYNDCNFATNQKVVGSFPELLAGICDKDSDSTKNTSFVDAKEYLQNKYLGLTYHVIDASQFKYWNRLDFPCSELFKENVDVERLGNWKPNTPTSTGYEPHVQKMLMTIPDNSYSVFIHPKTQERMKNDPKYAEYIAKLIDRHFQNTIRINEAISPGCTVGMCQAVTITEDGKIGFQASIVNGENNTKAKDNEGQVKEKEKPKKQLSTYTLVRNKPIQPIANIPLTVSNSNEHLYNQVYAYGIKRKKDFESLFI